MNVATCRTGALSGIIHGIVGVKQTGVAWSTFTVKPQLANLKFVNATVPTIRGPIVVAATPDAVKVAVPCNTQAILCVQSHVHAMAKTALMLDGEEVTATRTAHHLCTEAAVGCGSSARVVSITVHE
eukprot:COSAG02_NODE_558_length_20348_cov_6.479431_14_plen_127_part_00